MNTWFNESATTKNTTKAEINRFDMVHKGRNGFGTY